MIINNCQIEQTLQLISGKWKSVIIFMLLQHGTMRFSELQAAIPNCSKRMLSLQLKSLEQDQLIQKRVYATVPPKTEYSLTKLGAGLRPVIENLENWQPKD